MSHSRNKRDYAEYVSIYYSKDLSAIAYARFVWGKDLKVSSGGFFAPFEVSGKHHIAVGRCRLKTHWHFDEFVADIPKIREKGEILINPSPYLEMAIQGKCHPVELFQDEIEELESLVYSLRDRKKLRIHKDVSIKDRHILRSISLLVKALSPYVLGDSYSVEYDYKKMFLEVIQNDTANSLRNFFE